MSRLKAILLLLLLVSLALAAAGFTYQSWFWPWRLGLDLVGGSHLVYEVDLSQVRSGDQNSVLAGLRDVIERRVNLFGVSEPQVVIAKEGGRSRLIVELAGIKDVSVAIKEIGQTPFLEFRTLDPDSPPETPRFILTNLNGRYVAGAQLIFDSITNKPAVAISFNKEGGEIFATMTGENVGKPIGIFLDGVLIELPVVQEKISGGEARISGDFTVEQARLLVERFNAGALPAPITLLSQQTVGASLGQDTLLKTTRAGAIGTGLVALFMLFYYRSFGLAAAAALLMYAALTLGVFRLLGVTITLAGIAGFVLSIGMAVDANILIFERRKEEIKKGSSSWSAIEEGFRRAWPSIRDSNITTIITAIVLYYFTSGFIRGFALTLLIGVLVSMFSAITITKSILRAFTK